MGELSGNVAVVTGGGRGIGRAVALALAGAGADVAVLGRSAAPLDETVAAIEAAGGRGLAIVADVAEAGAVAGAFERARAAFGPITILVNNAGVTASRKFSDTDEATWERIMRVNATGPFLCCQAAVPDMIAAGRGRIITIASIAGMHGLPFGSAYSASKHAAVGLMRSLALELARYGITANALCPGWVETDMLDAAIAAIVARSGRSPEQARAEILALSGQEQAVQPAAIAEAVLRLAAPSGDDTTGEAIPIL